MKIKLFYKFLALMLILSVLPAVYIGISTININREGMQGAILELHTHLATALSDSVQNYLTSIDKEIQLVIKTIGTQMNWSDRQSVLQSLLDINGNLISISIVDKQGQEIMKAYNPVFEKNPLLLNKSSDETFKNYNAGPQKAALSEPYYSDNDPRINIIYPLTDEHSLYTVTSLSSLWEKVINTRLASTGNAFIVDSNGNIIADKNIELAKRKASAGNLLIVQQALKSLSVGSSEYTNPSTGKEMVGAYAPVKRLNWGIIIQQDKKEAYISVSRMKKRAILITVVIVFLAFLLSYFTAKGLTKPIMKLTQAAKLVAQKDFTGRVDVKSGDELQDFADTFNDMTTELRRYDEMQIDKIVAEKTKTESVIFSIGDGIIMTDKQGNVQLANTHAKQLLELPDEGWQGQHIVNFLKNEQLIKAFNEIVTSDKNNIVKKLDLSVGNINRFYKLSTNDVITPEKHEKIGSVAVLRNVTLEEELERMKDDFLHSITHDLRNPMTSIRGFLKFLIDGVAGPVNDQQKKMLDTMDRASNRLMGLINDILDIAKLESERLIPKVTENDLRQVAKRMLEIAEGQAIKKSIQLKIDAPENFPKISTDLDLMERVFTNLVGNAIKFTPENGTITVKFEEMAEKVKISVQDTGEGIPKEYITKIFDKFQQVTGQHKGGTGLGLTICKHIVEAHLGKIWAESVIGKGSSFIFTIPKNLTPNTFMMPAPKDVP